VPRERSVNVVSHDRRVYADAPAAGSTGVIVENPWCCSNEVIADNCCAATKRALNAA
jgi:hypothetical protein